MARGRMISTTIATDKRLALLSMNAEYVYLKTIPHLDRDGLILGDASVLWAKVTPRRPELLPETESCVREWITQNLVLAYETSDGLALYFLGFAKNQIGMRYEREPESTIACPPGYVRTPSGLVPDDSQQSSGRLPADIRQTSGRHPAEVKRKEVKEKGREEKGREGPEPPPPPPPPPAPDTAAADFDAEAFGCFVRRYENDIGLLTATIREEMLAYWQELEQRAVPGWAELAVQVAGDQNKRSWAYVRGILRNCIRTGKPPGAPKSSGNGSRPDPQRLQDPAYLRARYGPESTGVTL